MSLPDNPLSPVSHSGIAVDFKRVFFTALQNWYWVVLSVLVALAISFLNNRYAARIYPVTASVIIKETQETSGAELLYKNALIDPYKNYLNEIYIIKSYPLIQSVLEELNFGVQFFREGNILTSEVYEDFPLQISVKDKDQSLGFQYYFTVLNEREYQLDPPSENDVKEAHVFRFGDFISFRGDSIRVILKNESARLLEGLTGNKLLFKYTSPRLLTGSYVSRLTVDWAEEGAGVINLSVSGPNPKKDIDFIKGLVKHYQQYDLEKKNLAATRTIAFITNQLSEISDSLSHVESRLERFKGKNTVTDLSVEAARLFEKLEAVELQRTQFILRKKYYQYLTVYIGKNQNLDQVILPSSVGISDPLLTGFLTQLVALQGEVKALASPDRLENPLVSNLKNKLQTVKSAIVESVRNQESTDQIQEDFLAGQIKNLEKQLNYLPAAERQFISIQRNYSLLENLYIFLLQKQAEAGITKAANTSDIVMVNPPMAGGAISPKIQQNNIIALFAGLAIPFGIILLLELFNTKVQSKEDVEKVTAIPFIGGVGHKQSTDNRVVLAMPKSAVAESFRALRSNLTYFTKDKQNITILVSSSISGEGKTFTTINLATVLAFSEKRTLIVGADLRRPRLFDDFRLPNTRGLSSFLAGLSTFEEVLNETDQENLFLVTGGPVPPNPSELILSERMGAFFAEARKRFDYVIIDSPPFAIVADAFVLAQHSDHMLFLVRQNYTPKHMLQSVNDQYRSGRLKNISIVLNDIYKSGPGYGYGYGYGYGTKKNGYGYYTD